MQSKKASLDDKFLALVNKAESGKFDELTFIGTAESLLDDNKNAMSPLTFVHYLQRARRRDLDMVFSYLRRIGRTTREIKMMSACFDEIGVRNHGKKE